MLTPWRNKLRASDRPDRIFDAVRDLIALSGAVTGRDRRVLDSTVLDDAVARQDTVTMVTVLGSGPSSCLARPTDDVTPRDDSTPSGLDLDARYVKKPSD